MTHQGVARDAASVHFRPSIRRTDSLYMLQFFFQHSGFVQIMNSHGDRLKSYKVVENRSPVASNIEYCLANRTDDVIKSQECGLENLHDELR